MARRNPWFAAVGSEGSPAKGRAMVARESTQVLPAAGVREVIVPALTAILLGVFVVFATGFVGPTALHNAAHDARHSLTFPCH